MIPGNQKTSLLLDSQLPGFVRETPEYDNFRLFLQAYYEWLEQNNNITQESKSLLSYKDIDTTTDEFMDYFVNDFLQYFPEDALIDKKTAVKYARQLYYTKGTPASYQFLFRVLYNSDFELFYTKDAVLRASDGTWYVARSLRLATSDTNFLNIQNYRLFGETSKTIATVENTAVVGTKIDVFISNITRLFQSGEFVRVVDSYNQDVLFNGQPLRAKIIGQVNQIKIDPANRGLLYQPGDPVILYGGLNSNTGIGGVAEVGQTTTGSIERINVINGGYGYRSAPNTMISISNAPGAIATVSGLNPDLQLRANVALVPSDIISLKRYIALNATNYGFSNAAAANANTKLSDAFTFLAFPTYPISSVAVNNGGGGISQIPTATATSYYDTEATANTNLANLGILAPIQIIDGGHGYQANDVIVFSGGIGVGARANVTAVSATGSITRIQYVDDPLRRYPRGGFGYRKINLPNVTVQSANVQAANAQIYVPGILGEDATFSLVTNRTGSITTINLLDGGEDYVSAPNVSLKIQDIVVSNVSISNQPQLGDVVYQGANINVASYIATVNSVSTLQFNLDPASTLYNLRVFNYTSTPNPNLVLKIDRNINAIMANSAFNSSYNQNGVRTYGDGNARANASFLNGLVISQGQYLNSRGHPSSFDVLQSSIYNNYTYIITVQKEIEKYRDVLLNLLHPSGMKVLGRYALKANADYNMDTQEALFQGYPLDYYTQYPGSHAHIYTSNTNKSNNIIYFDGLAGANLQTFIFPGTSTITLAPTNGPSVYGEVVSVNAISNTVTISSNVWLTYANVAYVTGNASSNVINISSLTGRYDIINNGKYSNTDYPVKDIVYAGDVVYVDNNTSKVVSSVDYANNKLILTSNLTSSVGNSFLTVTRTYVANSYISSEQIRIYGPIGQVYVPQLTTEDGFLLTTEDGLELLLG